MRFPRKNRRPGVVASVEQQTAAAAALAQIAGQRRLTDPRTNPAVRQHADQLRDGQHRRALDAEDSRLIRRHRVEDHRAEHAERTLEAIQQARQTSSPARSVMALHTGRRRYMGVTLTASLTLSVGSAIGVARLAHQLGAPSAVGYIAEVGLTGLTTTVIMYRSHLTEHGGKVDGWQAKTLGLLMVVPLLATITANAISNGVVGVFCSTGASAFALLSAIISDRSAATLRARATEVTTDAEAELRAVAMGDDLFTAVQEADDAAYRLAAGHVLDTPADTTEAVSEPLSNTAQDTVSNTVPDTMADTIPDTVPTRSDTVSNTTENTMPDTTDDTTPTRSRTAKRTPAKRRGAPVSRNELARRIYDTHMDEHGAEPAIAELMRQLKDAGHPTGNKTAAGLLDDIKRNPLRVAQ